MTDSIEEIDVRAAVYRAIETLEQISRTPEAPFAIRVEAAKLAVEKYVELCRAKGKGAP